MIVREANIGSCYRPNSTEGGGYCDGPKEKPIAWLKTRGLGVPRFIYLNPQSVSTTKPPAPPAQVGNPPTPSPSPVKPPESDTRSPLDQAKGAATAFVSAHFTQCGPSTYFIDYMGPMVVLGARELRGFTWSITSSPVSSADKLNGVTARSVLTSPPRQIDFLITRTGGPSGGTAGAVQNPKASDCPAKRRRVCHSKWHCKTGGGRFKQADLRCQKAPPVSISQSWDTSRLTLGCPFVSMVGKAFFGNSLKAAWW